MIVHAKQDQVSYGESIGILLIDTYTPFIPGDVGNATTFSFPVRYQTVKGFSLDRIFRKDLIIIPSLVASGQQLVKDGVKAITGDCGFFALYQKELANQLDVPVFMSSLLQVPFISSMLQTDEKIGIICSNSTVLDQAILQAVGIHAHIPITIRGLEDQPHFYSFALEENGVLDTQLVEEEVVSIAKEMVKKDAKIKALLLECSLLPPYAAAIQRAVNLPVFDYITMINFVQSALVQKRYSGFM